MDSFANSDIQYDDGQLNREPVPEEIVVYGFKPPIRLPDGSIQEGDYLSANHLNYILNDLYNKFSNAMLIVDSGGDSLGGYRVYSNGDMEFWGLSDTGSDGTVTVTYPVAMPGKTNDIQVTDTANDFSSGSARVSRSSISATGFKIIVTNGTSGVAGRSVQWKAMYRVKGKN